MTEAVYDLIIISAILIAVVFSLINANKMINQLKKSEERYRNLAYHDYLTGLPNRRLFEEKFIQVRAQSEKKLAVLFVDLDGFKQINDSLGHVAGDQLLREFAKCLQACIRETDTLSRLAGDEFSILLHSTSYNEAVFITERILCELQTPFTLNGNEVYITPSIGIAFSEKVEDQPVELIKQADIAMYQAKNNGKNNYHIFNKEVIGN